MVSMIKRFRVYLREIPVGTEGAGGWDGGPRSLDEEVEDVDCVFYTNL